MRSRKLLILLCLLFILIVGSIGFWAVRVLSQPDDLELRYLAISGHWGQTDIGFVRSGPAPWVEGNCLTYQAEVSKPGGVSYRVVNMHAENFHAITRQTGMEKVLVRFVKNGAGQECVLIIDPRVPRGWLLPTGCSSCGCDPGNVIQVAYPDFFRGAD